MGLLDAKADGAGVKRLALEVLKRLLVSVGVLLAMAGCSFAYVSVFGPSATAAAGIELLVAWPWALPQIFVVVCLLWFVGQLAKRRRTS
jgi:hypothetical protein